MPEFSGFFSSLGDRPTLTWQMAVSVGDELDDRVREVVFVLRLQVASDLRLGVVERCDFHDVPVTHESLSLDVELPAASALHSAHDEAPMGRRMFFL